MERSYQREPQVIKESPSDSLTHQPALGIPCVSAARTPSLVAEYRHRPMAMVELRSKIDPFIFCEHSMCRECQTILATMYCTRRVPCRSSSNTRSSGGLSWPDVKCAVLYFQCSSWYAWLTRCARVALADLEEGVSMRSPGQESTYGPVGSEPEEDTLAVRAANGSGRVGRGQTVQCASKSAAIWQPAQLQ